MDKKNGKLSLEDFLILWSQKVGHGTSPNTMKKYLDGFQSAVLDELNLNGSIYIYNFGTFSVRQSGGDIKKMGDPINGGTVNRYVKPKLTLNFKPSGVLKRAINENDFELIKKKRKKKYSTKEYKLIRNERRRKPKPVLEELICDLLNESEKN